MIDTALQEKITTRIPDCNGDSTYIERLLQSDGITVIAGVDEAGRGPLAGPVVAAAVILPLEFSIPGITDSKLIPQIRRSRLALAIEETAVDIGIGVVGPEEIDRINILQATKKAIHIAVNSLSIKPELLLIDGKYLDCPGHRSASIIKGDVCCRTIAAASIMAKVTRDGIMNRLHEAYPAYGFNKHKGYPTKEHKAAINKYGYSPVHRRSFRMKHEE